MKRYFQPVEKDGSFKKHKEQLTANPSHSSPPTSNGTTVPPQAEEADGVKKEPLKFMSWNANSLLLRLKKNRTELADFVQRLDPDVIAIQEVRIPAAGGKGGSKNQGELKDDTSSAREEKQTLMRAISCPPLSNYRVWWSLGDTKYAGTALFVKHQCQPLKVTFSLDQIGSSALKHEVDGRVIVAEFEGFRLLNSYVPNNGWKDDETGFRRRRKWDQRMLDFVLGVSDKPLIWCGDLNVSHQDIDVSHPEFFSNAKIAGYKPPNKEETNYVFSHALLSSNIKHTCIWSQCYPPSCTRMDLQMSRQILNNYLFKVQSSEVQLAIMALFQLFPHFHTLRGIVIK